MKCNRIVNSIKDIYTYIPTKKNKNHLNIIKLIEI